MKKDNPHIIHVFNDDKFVDSAISIMEFAYPNSSDYYVINNSTENFKYVKSNKVKSLVLQTDTDYAAFVTFLINKKSNVVFFHALDKHKQKLVNLVPKNIVKVWLVWGYDLYSNWKLFDKNLYLTETKKYLLKDKTKIKNQLIYSELSFWLFHKKLHKKIWLPKRIVSILESSFYQEFYQAAEKIDIVAPVIPSEFEFIKKLKIKAKLAPFSYGTLEDLLQGNTKKDVLKSRNIIIGNSADPSNNHLDIFKLISKFNFKDQKIYVPLSYGGTKDYKEQVIDLGKKTFGNNFVSLEDFMTLEEYNSILLSCGYLIFNHTRQQGVGNIVSLGYMGAKLFLNKKSPVLTYFSQKGMTIFDTNSITEAQLNQNINQAQLKKNREVLLNEYSSQSVKKKIISLIEIVNSEINNKQNI